MRSSIAITITTVAIIVVATVLFSISSTDLFDSDPFVSSRSSSPPNSLVSIYVGDYTIPDLVADTNNQFAIEFYKRAAADTDENLFFSPISIQSAFSIVYEGAQEKTAQQIQDVFQFESDDIKRYELAARTISSLNHNDSSSTLEVANALWIADWFSPYDSYISIAKGIYYATSEPVDFIDDKTASIKKINDWAANTTYGKIDKIITESDVSDRTAIVINNAIYFKGSWVDPFSVNKTKESTFWRDSTDSVNTDFMNKRAKFYYTLSDDAQILRLPYKSDRLSMMIILPNDRDGISTLEKNISINLIKKWNQDVYPKNLQISIPKFTLSTNYDLKKLLIEMGITDVFDEKLANLSGMSYVEPERNLFVTKASHDAYVDVYEEGTEAAAVTSLVLGLQSKPPSFVANHPFLFLIQDNASGTILFLGKIMDPSV